MSDAWLMIMVGSLRKSAVCACAVLAACLCGGSAAARDLPAGVTLPHTEEGTIGVARFLIHIPAGWNGGLMVWAHGYMAPERGLPKRLELYTSTGKHAFAVAHEKGYATAISSFSNLGFARREGAMDSETLRDIMTERAGGNPFDNTNTVYFGSDDDAALNRGVGRYAADPEAAEWMRQWYSIRAEITDPVISVHALRDPIVPLKTLRAYDVASQIGGTNQLFVQKWVDQTGTAYNRVVVEEAFNELEAWIRHGTRPRPGEIVDPDHGRQAARETAEHFAELWQGAGPAPSARQQ